MNVRIGKYRLIEKIGEGSFSVVYKVHDENLDQIKALKILKLDNPESTKKKLEEAQILNKYRGNKHIVQIYSADISFFNNKKILYIDMEYISGGSLGKITLEQLSFGTSILYIIHILHALEALHNDHMIHRDIKPANILIDNNYAKLTDFGLATILCDEISGSSQGYETHKAPEVFTEQKTTIQSDIFATGITFFRILGHYNNWDDIVWSINNYPEFCKNGILIEKIGFPNFMPKKLKSIIRKACHPERDLRFQSASEMIKSLSNIKINVDWTNPEPDLWKGIDNCGKQYSAKVIHSTKKYYVEIQKSQRNIRSLCKSYQNIILAREYLEKYIASSTLY